jgi:hypothetical protein
VVAAAVAAAEDAAGVAVVAAGAAPQAEIESAIRTASRMHNNFFRVPVFMIFPPVLIMRVSYRFMLFRILAIFRG